jgi:hypothetical protein
VRVNHTHLRTQMANYFQKTQMANYFQNRHLYISSKHIILCCVEKCRFFSVFSTPIVSALFLFG